MSDDNKSFMFGMGLIAGVIGGVIMRKRKEKEK